jgi:hypothetical protein
MVVRDVPGVLSRARCVVKISSTRWTWPGWGRGPATSTGGGQPVVQATSFSVNDVTAGLLPEKVPLKPPPTDEPGAIVRL